MRFNFTRAMTGFLALLLCPSLLLAQPASQQQSEVKYLTGGPLAGIELPLYPTYHGEPAGRPGKSGNTVQLQLYPGSVENWRAYMGKYMPIRSFFDQQSLVKRWIAPEIPGVSSSGVKGTYAQPIWHVPKYAKPTPTNTFEPPVSTITLKPGDTIAQINLGKLDVGLYCVRVVAAVPAEQLHDFFDDLLIRMDVNDKIDGGQSQYVVRAGYCDQFYSLVEIYFHAPQAREYSFKLAIDPASKVNVIVRSVILDDALAGMTKRAIKTKSINPVFPELLAIYKEAEPSWTTDPAGREARLRRDAAIWDHFPAVNKPWVVNIASATTYGHVKAIRIGAQGKDMKQLTEAYGQWVAPKSGFSNVMMHNQKLDLDYTWDDYNANKPLPDPYPIKDNGTGVGQRDADSDTNGQFYPEVANISHQRLRAYQQLAYRAAGDLTVKKPEAARDALMALTRFVYDYPTMDVFKALDSVVTQTGAFGRNMSNRRRDTPAWFLTWYTEYANFCQLYDKLFPLIQGNEELAQSVGRFIPWIKNSQDLVKFFDMYLVQQTAKKVLRYHYHTYPTAITKLAAVMGDKDFTRPWMEWQFSRTWAYPFPLAGIQDYMVSVMDRSGVARGGTSSFYASGKSAFIYAQDMEEYAQADGLKEYMLLDPQKYPKVYASLEWPIELYFAGLQYIRVGDVSGPEKPVGHLITTQLGAIRSGWEWTQDPRDAAILAAFDSSKKHTPEQWEAITKAASGVKRLPYYDQRSRFLPNWAGFLETGQQHDDVRFRRGVAVRTGLNYGHSHADSLDLQVAAHGVPLVLDGGQRPSYTAPSSAAPQVHNLVTSDNRGAADYAWIRSLSDNPGVQYMVAQRGEPTGPLRGQRQVALIDVDEGEGDVPLTINQQKPGAKLPPVQSTANSYILDVFRASAGRTYQYNFHAMVNDQFEWNAQDIKAPAAGYKMLGTQFPANELNAIGTAPQTFQATWRMQKESNDISTNGTEKGLLRGQYDPKSPYKFLRLHLFDVKGMTTQRAQFYTNTPPKNQMTMISVTNAKANARDGAVFLGLIEPYAGQPIIASSKALPIADNEKDALRAVALHVTTVNGHDDLLMADGRPEKTRSIEGDIQFAGDFAIISKDSQGLRLASITGGTTLQSTAIRLSLETRAYTANITKVDYYHKQITIDQLWPERSNQQLVEVGHDKKMTAYTLTAIKTQGGQSVLTTLRGADFFLSPIHKITIEPKDKPAVTAAVPEATDKSADDSDDDSADKSNDKSSDKTDDESAAKGDDDSDDDDTQATTPIPQGPVINQIRSSLTLVPRFDIGRQKGWVLSNDSATKFWRANANGSNNFILEQDTPVDPKDFGTPAKMRLWEYGVGDQVQQRTTASVVRTQDKTYKVQATTNITLSLPGSKMELSTDQGKTWTAIGKAQGGWVTAKLTASQTADDPVLVRLQ